MKNYLFNVFDKIGVSSRAELILNLLSSSAPPKKHVTGANVRRSQQKLDLRSRPTPA